MSKFSTAKKLFFSNRNIFISRLILQFAFVLKDKTYIDLMFKYCMGYKINWNNPRTFNEKLNWMKLNYHNPIYPKLVNKESVKLFVEERIGKDHVIPTIGKWDNPTDIDFSMLPNQFVLKTTHGGGNNGVIICKNKEDLDIPHVREKLRNAMKQNLYLSSREWPYKNVKRQIICEPYIEDKKTGELRDYKFFCFDGIVKALFVATDRQKREEPFFNFFDENYNPLQIKQGHPVATIVPEKPILFNEMKKIASILSQNIPHVRVDLYEANGKILFGELTFYHFGALVPFEPQIWDYKFGEWLTLPKKID